MDGLDGSTALHVFCQGNFFENFEKFLDLKKADLNIRNWNGDAPIHVAAWTLSFGELEVLSTISPDNAPLRGYHGSTRTHLRHYY